MKQKLITILKWLLLKLEGEQTNPLVQTVGDLEARIQKLAEWDAAQKAYLKEWERRLNTQGTEFADRCNEYEAKIAEIGAERDAQIGALCELGRTRDEEFEQYRTSADAEFQKLEHGFYQARAGYESEAKNLSSCIDVLQSKIAEQSLEIAHWQQVINDKGNDRQRLELSFADERKDYEEKIIGQGRQIQNLCEQALLQKTEFEHLLVSQANQLEAGFICERLEFNSRITDLEAKLAEPRPPTIWYRWKRYFLEPLGTEQPKTIESERRAMAARMSSLASNGRRF